MNFSKKNQFDQFLSSRNKKTKLKKILLLRITYIFCKKIKLKGIFIKSSQNTVTPISSTFRELCERKLYKIIFLFTYMQ